MRPGPAPTFGKRNLRASSPARPAPDPHQAFFAALRNEGEAARPAGPRAVVPRSWRAGLLAGLVVACALAGVEATRDLAEMRHLAEVTEGRIDVRMVGPALILLAIAGGGRSAATALLLSHSALSRLGRTEPWAYALGGAAAAGALGGFFYRVFAGKSVA